MQGRTRTILAIIALPLLLLASGCPSSGGNRTGSGGGSVSSIGSGTISQGSPFSLEAHSLGEELLLGAGQVLSGQPNCFAGNDLASEGGQASLIQLRPRGIEPMLNIPHKLGGARRVVQFFPDGRLLLGQDASGGDAVRMLMVDSDTGTELDVTPSNLAPLWDGPEDLPFVAWTGKHGLCISAPGRRPGELVLWEGHNTLAEVQQLPGILATGWRMREEGPQFLAVNAVLELLAFDEVEGKLLPDPEGTDLAAAIADAAGDELGTPLRFAAGEALAVLQTRDTSHWALVGSADAQDYIEVHDASGMTPDGRRRIPGPGDLLGGSEAQRLRREGANQDPSIINEGFVLPLNAGHVGIFDLIYQRLIVIGLEDVT
ncbi:MAG: hypothetical protein R3F46_07930 [bacterium]